MSHTDTITAQATPPGRGGVAIVRISGAKVKKVMQSVLAKILLPRQANYLPFYDTENHVIDQGIAIYFPSPHSFTGEDVLELHAHGGPIVIDLILETILKQGVRLARPGEFSERAFLNNKLDLIQAEAMADLINASSKQAARSAMRSLQGEFSKVVHEIVEKITQLRIYIEAAIDFSEEEINFFSDQRILSTINQILLDLAEIQSKAKQGSLLREGITIVIAGKPNVGKSSLLNALSGEEIAIVTNIPGTTRDLLRNNIIIDGIPIHIVDTAGLRNSDDVVEQEGIRRAYHEMEKADLVFYMIDASHPEDINFDLIPQIIKNKPLLLIRNKLDLINEQPGLIEKNNLTILSLSAKTREGILFLHNYIKNKVGFVSETDNVFIARRRHLDALQRASRHVAHAKEQLKMSSCHGELAAEDLRQAQLVLAEITGKFTADDLLGRIFSSFCIGK